MATAYPATARVDYVGSLLRCVCLRRPSSQFTSGTWSPGASTTPLLSARKRKICGNRALSITGRSPSRTSVHMLHFFSLRFSCRTSSIIVGRARPWMVGAWRRTSRHRAPPRLPLPTASAARDLRQGSRLPSPRPPLTPPRRSPPPGRRRLTRAALTVVEMVWEVASRSGRDQVEIRR